MCLILAATTFLREIGVLTGGFWAEIFCCHLAQSFIKDWVQGLAIVPSVQALGDSAFKVQTWD